MERLYSAREIESLKSSQMPEAGEKQGFEIH